jgi:phosphoglycolate phosphatase-like HAD superfamily hydrolase
MLDPDILTQMMQDAGAAVGAIRRAMPEIIQLAQRLYLGSCPDLRRKTCPGARALLERLRGGGAVLGLVTGNLTAIGWKKLERAGLREYFQFGAFGEMAPNRAGLARLAIRRARRERLIGQGAPVALIGDAPSDIIAAKASGARAIAVATGISTPDELLAHDPDLLLSDLRELRLSMLA